jgi:hypothetical protein
VLVAPAGLMQPRSKQGNDQGLRLGGSREVFFHMALYRAKNMFFASPCWPLVAASHVVASPLPCLWLHCLQGCRLFCVQPAHLVSVAFWTSLLPWPPEPPCFGLALCLNWSRVPAVVHGGLLLATSMHSNGMDVLCCPVFVQRPMILRDGGASRLAWQPLTLSTNTARGVHTHCMRHRCCLSLGPFWVHHVFCKPPP